MDANNIHFSTYRFMAILKHICLALLKKSKFVLEKKIQHEYFYNFFWLIIFNLLF